jgi:acetyl-CoA synthetase
VAACDCVESVIVVQNTKGDVAWGNKDVWYHNLVEDMWSHHLPVVHIQYKNALLPNQHQRCTNNVWYHDLVEDMSKECPCESFDAETPLFILYTSGSTGKPKGVLHTTGGYLLYAAMTHKYVFDYQDGDIYWCSADIGWVTGHSYIVYGPLANGATTLMFEGIPTYPDASRFWQVIQKMADWLNLV